MSDVKICHSYMTCLDKWDAELSIQWKCKPYEKLGSTTPENWKLADINMPQA